MILLEGKLRQGEVVEGREEGILADGLFCVASYYLVAYCFFFGGRSAVSVKG